MCVDPFRWQRLAPCAHTHTHPVLLVLVCSDSSQPRQSLHRFILPIRLLLTVLAAFAGLVMTVNWMCSSEETAFVGLLTSGPY
jgi:hypothetical protein